MRETSCKGARRSPWDLKKKFLDVSTAEEAVGPPRSSRSGLSAHFFGAGGGDEESLITRQ